MKFNYEYKDTFRYKKNKLREENKLKVSFCMTCMNRLHHVKQTLETSIISNKSYNDVEFVLLDYNSQDGLEKWIKENMMEYIESGILNYYKTIEPKYFNMTHAKNIVHKLGTGDVLCNLDADNFALRGHADYIMDIFWDHYDEDVFLAPCKRTRIQGSGVWGRICVRRKTFYKLGGYNEIWNRWGGDDHDMRIRLQMSGSKWICFDIHYLMSINHSSNDRFDRYKKIRGRTMKSRISGKRSYNLFVNYRKKYGHEANQKRHWGKANVIKNFTELIRI